VNQSQCARYYVWCAYVDPNYQGGGRSEYADGDSELDCHNDDTEWQILGCYRQELYNTVEQLSKHIWSADDEDYETTCSSLDYMTKYDCRQVGYDDSGNTLYAGVKPVEGGYFQMALYTESNCLAEDTSSGYTYDDFAVQEDNDNDEERKLGSHDENQGSGFDYNGDYTMSGVNEIMDGFKYCTLCMDYPTYQDGSENGGDGYDDDNLINQCWKLWSHDSYPCNTDCIALASSQGTLLSVQYGSFAFGEDSSSFSFDSGYSYSGTSAGTTAASNTYSNESNFEKMKANAFLILAGVVFLTTFLSFGIARSSLHKSNETISGNTRLSKKSKSRKSRSQSRSSVAPGTKSRSKSRSRRMLDDDYEQEKEEKSTSRRSKSRPRQRSQSRSRKHRDEEENRKSRSPSKQRNSRSNKYEAPSIPDGERESTRKSSRRGQRTEEDRARRQRDDF